MLNFTPAFILLGAWFILVIFLKCLSVWLLHLSNVRLLRGWDAVIEVFFDTVVEIKRAFTAFLFRLMIFALQLA